MNTPISSVNVKQSGKRWGKDAGAVAAASVIERVPAPQAQPAAQVRGAPASGWRYSAQLNEQLTSAQQALSFVDGLLGQLEGVKSGLSRELTQRQLNQGDLQRQLEQFNEQWRKRQTASGGSLDGQLRFHLAADARQGFTVKGLDLAALSGGQAETLVFSTGESGAAPASVQVGGASEEEDLLRRFNRGLAASGVRAEMNEDGQLAFSVPESQWGALSERMTVRGGGIRFPGGIPQRLKLQPEAEAFQPERWKVGDHAQVRQALQSVVRSIGQLQQTRAAINSAIAEAQHSIEQLSHMNEQSWASQFVSDFNARLNQPDGYRNFYELVPALIGVSRYRVVSLLSLG